jgi:hypothetical protein
MHGRTILSILGACLLPPILVACLAPTGPENLVDTASALGSSESSGEAGAPAIRPVCFWPAEGCPCDQPGLEVLCRGGTTRDGDYVTCPAGRRTCSSEGVWGPCRWPHEYVPDAGTHESGGRSIR